jgi:hypothetical protein
VIQAGFNGDWSLGFRRPGWLRMLRLTAADHRFSAHLLFDFTIQTLPPRWLNSWDRR